MLNFFFYMFSDCTLISSSKCRKYSEINKMTCFLHSFWKHFIDLYHEIYWRDRLLFHSIPLGCNSKDTACSLKSLICPWAPENILDSWTPACISFKLPGNTHFNLPYFFSMPYLFNLITLKETSIQIIILPNIEF